MTKNLDVSDSNSILKTIVIVLIVTGIAYLIYNLYNQHKKITYKNTLSNEEYISDNITQEDKMTRTNYTSPEEGIVNAQYKMNGRISGQNNPIDNKINYLPKGEIVGSNTMEHFSADENYKVERNLTSFPKDQLTAEELLPQDNSSLWAQVNPVGEGSLKDRNFLQAGYNIGINTVGQTLRNANLQLRSEPPCPQVRVSPWAQSTIEPDVSRKPFEIGGCA